MTKTSVNYLLAIYFLLVWTAMAVRVEYFPLTWAPMYSLFLPGDTISSEINDARRQAQGLRITHRDGATGYIRRSDLNIPERHFRRLYFKRMFAFGPEKESVMNRSLGAFNRWLWDIDDEDLTATDQWDWRILRSLNRTLGHTPNDPQFIIRVEADRAHVRYRKADLATIEQTSQHAAWNWQEEWSRHWTANGH